MIRMRWCLWFLIACGASKPPPDPAFTTAGPKPCEKMADHLVKLMNPDPEVATTSDKITRVLIDTCVNDKWTVDAQQCFLGLGKLEEADSCTPLLTPDQRENADKAMASAFEAKGSG